jgi:hypothetical protein
MKKLYDLAVKTGSYQKGDETKNRYANIGAIMEGTDGNRFLFINRHFNPAGVPFKEGSESIIVSMFKPKAADDQQSPPPPVSDDDIPL